MISRKPLECLLLSTTAWVLAGVLLLLISMTFPQSVNAAQLTSRSVVIASSQPSATTSHAFEFNIMSGILLGSIEFEYCDNNPFIGSPCTAPTGLSLSTVVLAAQTGEVGFIIHPSSTVNRLILARVPDFPTPQPVQYLFTGVVNPSEPQRTYYVRISTFSSNDATGSRIDQGAVVFSTVRALNINGYVPPFLIFCVGVSVSSNCSTATGSLINLEELSKTSANTATSQFNGATNDPTGYFVSLAGTTMTSGANIIPALTVPTPSAPGTSQFGINLRANTIPSVGADPVGAGTSVGTADFNIPNQYVFKNATLTDSSLPTEFKIFTVSYVVNVSTSQLSGIYTTTLTFVAIAAF